MAIKTVHILDKVSLQLHQVPEVSKELDKLIQRVKDALPENLNGTETAESLSAQVFSKECECTDEQIDIYRRITKGIHSEIDSIIDSIERFQSETPPSYVHVFNEEEAARLLDLGRVSRNGVYNNRVASILENASSVLEMGCGSGANIFYQLLTFPNIMHFLGIDIEERYQIGIFENLHKVDPALLKRVSLIRGDVLSKAFEMPETQDVVFGTYVLEHLPQPQKAIQEALRLVRPNGSIIFTECSWEKTNIVIDDKKDPELKQWLKEYQKLKDHLVESQRKCHGNPYYGTRAIMTDFNEVLKKEHQVDFCDIEYSPGRETSCWLAGAEGESGAIEFIFALIKSTYDEKNQAKALEKINILKENFQQKLCENPKAFHTDIVVTQAIVTKT